MSKRKPTQREILESFMKKSPPMTDSVYWLEYLNSDWEGEIKPEQIEQFWDYVRENDFWMEIDGIFRWYFESFKVALKDAESAPDSRHVSAITPVD